MLFVLYMFIIYFMMFTDNLSWLPCKSMFTFEFPVFQKFDILYTQYYFVTERLHLLWLFDRCKEINKTSLRIWKRLNLCKTFWSGERNCLIVAKIWLCQTFDYVETKVKYFSYHFLKSVSRFYFVSMKIFLLWLSEASSLWLFGMMKKKNIFVFAERLNEITVK